MIGDAALMTEAAERGLRKVDPLRAALEISPEESDRTVAGLATFHARHPVSESFRPTTEPLGRPPSAKRQGVSPDNLQFPNLI